MVPYIHITTGRGISFHEPGPLAGTSKEAIARKAAAATRTAAGLTLTQYSLDPEKVSASATSRQEEEYCVLDVQWQGIVLVVVRDACQPKTRT